MTHTLRDSRRLVSQAPVWVLLGVSVTLSVLGGLAAVRLQGQPVATPFPLPVYEIEATSVDPSGNPCKASIANLGVGYVGALQAPVPVDVNCDLLPDVMVGVNLVDLEGPVNDPLATDSTTYEQFVADRAARTLAPNIEINRHPLDAASIALSRPSPPVRINVKMTIRDLDGAKPDTHLRFGYDTGEGGSIPTHFKALVRGLDTFFNPLEAVVDTKGGTQGGDAVPTYYQGPLTLIGGVATSDENLDAKLDIAYSPFPDVVRVGYTNDDKGNHIDYAHGIGEETLLKYGRVFPDGTLEENPSAGLPEIGEQHVPGQLPEIDMVTTLNVAKKTAIGTDTLDLRAEVDRLPRRIGLDADADTERGRLDYDASADGRLPDARIALRSKVAGEVIRAKAHVEEIPPELHALWSLASDNEISALFTTSSPDAEGFDVKKIGEGPGIGAIEVEYSNVDELEAIQPFVPTEQQFLNLQTLGGEQLVTARVERIRGMSFATRADGFDVVSRIGDGALPLQTHIQTDGLPGTGGLLSATATVSPLPAEIDLNLFNGEKGNPDNPFRVVYKASQSVDVDGRVEVREKVAATAGCGEPGTLCVDLDARHLPAELSVSVAETDQPQGVGSTTNVAIDSKSRPSAPKPDVFVDAVVGKDDSLSDPNAVADAGPVILEAKAELRGIPEKVRLRFVEGADETLELFDFATCELAEAKCPAGSGRVERVEVQLRNFHESERADASVPLPASVAPQFATLSARGIDDPNKTADPTVRFEATARVRDITEVRYANVNGLFGVRSVVGDNRDLEVLLDIANVIFSGNDPTTGPVDLRGRALVSPLPSDIDVCLREANFPLNLAHSATFTDRCESTDPFGDGSATTTPLTFAYDANSGFDVDASVDFKARGLDSAAVDDHDIHGKLVLDDVPSDLTAHVATPPEKDTTSPAPPAPAPERLRLRTIAPGATGTDVEFAFEDRRAGASCADPEPAGDVTCLSGTVTGLPDYASVLAETGPNDSTKARIFACDLLVASDTCRAGTEGDIDDMTARLRMVAGDPVEEGDLVPFVFDEHPYRKAATPADSYVLALRLDQDDENNKELRAEGRLADFRNLSLDRSADGFDVRTDLGDGKTPLLGSIAIDTRVPASAPPPPPGEEPKTGQLIKAETRIDPLPQRITISQHGPGADQQSDPLNISYTSTGPVEVDARAEIFGQVAGPLCGDHGTMCATLALDRLPTTINASIGTFDAPLPETPSPNDVRRQMFVDLDALPFSGVDAPDLTLDAVLGGTPEGSPPFDDTPIVAHGELRGFSERVRVRTSQVGTLLADGSLEDGAFEEAILVTCELDPNSDLPQCAGPRFPVREVALSARNFHQRPADFPGPRQTAVPVRNSANPPSSHPMYAEVVGRGEKFEAHAGFTSVREFRMVNVDEILGVKVSGGDRQAFSAHGDFAGLVLPDRDLEGPSFERRTLSFDAEASLSSVPTEFSFCMRESGAPIKSLTGDFTEPCEDNHPFSDPFFRAEQPESGPLSFAYRANAPIKEILTTATARVHRAHVLPLEFLELVTPLPTVNVFGDVKIENLPKRLTAHIETPVDKEDDDDPKEKGGPIRALFFYTDPSNSEPPPVDPVHITFAARYTMGDAICRDLRDEQVAFCFKGKVENLPSTAKAYIDPEAELFEQGTPGLVQNLRIETDNTDPAKKLNLRGLDLSVVKDDDPAKKPLVLVATGDILGLPTRVDGTIHMPDEDPAAFDKPAFDITASPPLDKVDVEIQNFVAPNPLPPVPSARGGVVPDQSVIFQQRGDFFKADVDIENVAGGGYRTGRNAAGQATETQLLRVDFGIPSSGPKPTIRGFADLLTVNDLGHPTHVFADVLLDDVPHGIDICFRGEFPDPPDHDLTAAPGTETYCDQVPPNLGGFKFKGRVSGDPEPELDVNAFFRMTKDSDTNVLKVAADITNIPNVIEGTFGDGAVSVSAFKANGTTPTGIDDVVAEMADFDFQNDGYGNAPPWGVRVPGSVTLPPAQPGPAHEFARVAANGTDFHVKAHIGTAHDGSDGARITKFIMDPTPCPQPAGAATYFPHYPLPDNDPSTKDNEYTCIRGDLEAHSGHPLLVDADLVLDGTPLQIVNAGLTAVPKFFQVTIAKTETFETKVVSGHDVPDALRRRCRPAAEEPDDARDCMPPLLHFDSEGDAQLFGQLLLGEKDDLEKLRKTSPVGTMVDLEEHPVPHTVRGEASDRWSEFPGGKGVRVKLGEFPRDKSQPASEDRKAVRAGFRLDLPRALTVDQVQKWSVKDASSDAVYSEASDLRFHYVLRKAPASGTRPQVVETAGELAAMIHNFDNNGQTLVSHVDDDMRGIPIPGEFGVDLYDRDFKGKGRRLIQADLRTSVKLAARLRLIAGKDASLGDVDARLRDLNGIDPSDSSYQTDPDKPSFRVRAELKDPADQVNPPAPPGGGDSDWKDALLCLVFCIADDIGDPNITADVDLEHGNKPVRLLEAVVNTVDKLGLELRSYADIDGNQKADFSADSSHPGFSPLVGLAPFSPAGLHVDLPFNFFLHVGVPVLASLDVLVLSNMAVDFDIATTDRLVLKQNTTVLELESDGAQPSVTDLGSDTWLQVGMKPGMLGAFFSLFWPFPPVHIFYGMQAGPVMPFYFYRCPTPLHMNGAVPWTFPVFDFPQKATAFLPYRGPSADPVWLRTFGTPGLREVIDAVFGLAGPPILCAIFDDVSDIALHSGHSPSHNGDRSPGDPLVIPGHAVAGLGITAAPAVVVPPPAATPAPRDLTVAAGTTIGLCGSQAFNKITIEATATLSVRTAPFDDPATPFVECPANVADNPTTADDETQINVGRLSLVAAGLFDIKGRVNGRDAQKLALTGHTLTLQSGGRIDGGAGFLEVNAGDKLEIAGVIDANAVIPSMPLRSDTNAPWAASSTGNAGASHGGAGNTGTGAGGAAGPVYGNGVDAAVQPGVDPGTEAGSRGGSPDGDTIGGKGGGAIVVRGSVVTVTGTITANGAEGEDEFSGECSAPDDPDVEGDQSRANSGQAAGGGGSGGGVAIHGVTVEVTGFIRVRGGSGGEGRAGAGGGGGGGVIRLNAGDVDHDTDALVAGKGIGGFSLCPADFGNGNHAADGIVEVTESPASHAFAQDRLWFKPSDVAIPYRASAATIPGWLSDNNDFRVYLCGIRRGPEAIQDGDQFGLKMPEGEQPTGGNPCGTKSASQGADSAPVVLATVDHNDVEVSPDGATIAPSSPLPSGIWGLWTVAAKPDVGFLGCNAFWPAFNLCSFETNPRAPEVIVGVDPLAPHFSMSPIGTTPSATAGEAVTGTRAVSLALSSVTDELPRLEAPAGMVPVSGIDGFRCFLDDGSLDPHACNVSNDIVNLTLPNAQGRYTVYVVATDQAGNHSAPLSGGVPDVSKFTDGSNDPWDDDRLTFVYDATAPHLGSATITAPASPNGQNGWYVTPPTQYRIEGFDDGASGSGPHPDGAFQYRFDGADWTSCANPCVIQAPTPLPGPGTHALSWKARDAAGLESAEGSVPIRIDVAVPKTAVNAVPDDDGWITAAHPLVVARGVDEFGGSGIGTSTDPALCDGNPATGLGLSGTCISVNGTTGPFVPYDGPVELFSGEDQVVCAYSVDVAGHAESPVTASPNCTKPLDIDNQLPTGSISVAPPAPTGNPPWYDGDAALPVVTLFGYNGTGSPAPPGGGFRYRVDNSAEESCSDPCVVTPTFLDEGSNVLHWTVVDSAGNRRPEQKVDLFVDTDDPRTHILVDQRDPDGSNDWHLQKPSVTLVGFDEPVGSLALRPIGSGVASIGYTLDGIPFVYAGPFLVGAGSHELCVGGRDVAGNDEKRHCRLIKVDEHDPQSSVLQNGSLTPVNDGDNGWYKLSPVTITETSSDPAPGSSVIPQALSPALCDHRPDSNPAPAGVCISVDGRAPGAGIGGPEFGPYNGPVLLGEGEHVIRVFAVDNAGRRSAVDREVVRIDRSDPVSIARLRAPHASRIGLLRPWWRHEPTLVLRALDGDHNAGIRRIEYRMNGGPVNTYTEAVRIPAGIGYVEHRAVDEAGRIGAWRRINVAVDVTPPSVDATTPDPMVWLYTDVLGVITFGPEKAKLHWTVSDDLSGKVRVRVIVYSVAGLAVRHLDGGVHDVTPGQSKSGFTYWDGTDDSLIGFVPAGVYYYRVVATDDGGNVAMSGESERLQIKLHVKETTSP